MESIKQAFESGKKARFDGYPGYANPFTYWSHPDEACAWDDGWMNDGKRTSVDTVAMLKSRNV